MNILGMGIVFVLQGKTSRFNFPIFFSLIHLGGSIIPQGKLPSPIGTRCHSYCSRVQIGHTSRGFYAMYLNLMPDAHSPTTKHHLISRRRVWATIDIVNSFPGPYFLPHAILGAPDSPTQILNPRNLFIRPDEPPALYLKRSLIKIYRTKSGQ